MKRVKLGEVADVRISGVDKKIIPGEFPILLCNYTDVYYNWTIRSEMQQRFMEASARREEIEKFRLQSGQVAITKDSETRDDIGHSAYIANDFENVILGYHCALISPFEGKLDGQYLNALFRTRCISDYFSRNAGGSGQRYYLSESSIKETPLFLPSYDTQLRISNILGSFDEKIEVNRRKINELEELAQTIYDYWFVQFDFPDKDGKPYKSSGGKMVWNEKLKREIPEGWEVAFLPALADYLFGFPFDSSLFNVTGSRLPIVRIRNVKDGFTNDATIEKVDNSYIISNGDFLIGMDGYFAMGHWIGGKAYLVQRTCRIQPKRSLFYGWLPLALKNPIEHLEKTLAGATVAHLGKSHLDRIALINPPLFCSKRALTILNDITSRKVALATDNYNLSKQRDYLLPLLMNGQVEVRE